MSFSIPTPPASTSRAVFMAMEMRSDQALFQRKHAMISIEPFDRWRSPTDRRSGVADVADPRASVSMASPSASRAQTRHSRPPMGVSGLSLGERRPHHVEKSGFGAAAMAVSVTQRDVTSARATKWKRDQRAGRQFVRDDNLRESRCPAASLDYASNRLVRGQFHDDIELSRVDPRTAEGVLEDLACSRSFLPQHPARPRQVAEFDDVDGGKLVSSC